MEDRNENRDADGGEEDRKRRAEAKDKDDEEGEEASADQVAEEKAVEESSTDQGHAEKEGDHRPSRTKWSQQEEVRNLCRRLAAKEFRSVVVVTGAGVSTAAGVPDFRSDDGIYSRLEQHNLPSPESVFDIDYFRTDPEPFYSLAQELQSDSLRPTFAHRFVRLLHDKAVLRRLYTQNIDGLDSTTGLASEKIIEAHGSFSSARCLECSKSATKQANEAVRTGTVPRCTECNGLIKPDIVFFGEALPDKFHRNVSTDTRTADLCIVMGTSLKVMPIACVPDMVPRHVPRILINREMSGTFLQRKNDLALLGDIEEIVRDLAEMCGWLADLETMECP